MDLWTSLCRFFRFFCSHSFAFIIFKSASLPYLRSLLKKPHSTPNLRLATRKIVRYHGLSESPSRPRIERAWRRRAGRARRARCTRPLARRSDSAAVGCGAAGGARGAGRQISGSQGCSLGLGAGDGLRTSAAGAATVARPRTHRRARAEPLQHRVGAGAAALVCSSLPSSEETARRGRRAQPQGARRALDSWRVAELCCW